MLTHKKSNADAYGASSERLPRGEGDEVPQEAYMRQSSRGSSKLRTSNARVNPSSPWETDLSPTRNGLEWDWFSLLGAV